MNTPEFGITVGGSRRQVVVSVSGDLDLGTCSELIDTARRALPSRPDRLVIDLAKVGFCSSAAIGALVQIKKWAAACRADFFVTNVGDEVYRVFTVAGVAQALNATRPGPHT